MAKKALLVGINQFQGSGVTPLRGCVNDVIHWADTLASSYGFAERDIEVLRDGQATRRVMLRALESLLQSASPGDTLAFFVSSHGTQVPDYDGDEIDDMDEVLVTHDFTWDTALTDDELAEYFARVPSGVDLICVFDTCHSGTMLDAKSSAYRAGPQPGNDLPPGAYARFLPTPIHLLEQHRTPRASRPRAYAGFGPQGGTGGSSKPRPGGRPPGLRQVVPGLSLSAASDNETAADAEFGGTPFGAFSYSLMAALREGSPQMSWEQAHQEATRRLRARGFRQTPQIQVPPAFRNQPVFGGRMERAVAQVPSGFGPPTFGPAPLVAERSGPLAMSNPIDTALAEFKPDDYSVRLCGALFSVVPFAGPILPYTTVEGAIQALYPQASPQVVRRAYELTRNEAIQSALRAADMIDKADAGIAMYSGVKGAFNLLFGERSQALETDTQQGVDAVLKLLGIGYLIAKMYPGSIQERVQSFYTTPAGKHLIVYYALIEVALPFLDNALTASGNFIGSLISKHGGEAAGKLSAAVGSQDSAEAQGVIQTMLSWIEGALTSILPYAQAAAEKARQYIPGALVMMDKAASVVATGADALPVYRYLGARLAAESVVLLASRGA
ncbi:MAG: caspase family protein [Myxococcales bacterium]|nr:caspase family protein [Polyangiaceae bacterium]MDW8251267.1 caspase family protein [Myxococcales bacterium]